MACRWDAPSSSARASTSPSSPGAVRCGRAAPPRHVSKPKERVSSSSTPRASPPFDEDTVLGSVRRTGRLVIVHEAPGTGGFGAEIAARVAERALDSLLAPDRAGDRLRHRDAAARSWNATTSPAWSASSRRCNGCWRTTEARAATAWIAGARIPWAAPAADRRANPDQEAGPALRTALDRGSDRYAGQSLSPIEPPLQQRHESALRGRTRRGASQRRRRAVRRAPRAPSESSSKRFATCIAASRSTAEGEGIGPVRDGRFHAGIGKPARVGQTPAVGGSKTRPLSFDDRPARCPSAPGGRAPARTQSCRGPRRRSPAASRP